MQNNKAVQNLKRQWDENPLNVIAVGAGAAIAASKLIDSLSGVQSRRAYAKRMNPKKK